MDPFESLRKQLEAQIDPTPRVVQDIDKKIAQVFGTLQGKEVLEIFEDMWVRVSLFVPGDSHATAYKVGQSDLINFIKDSIRNAGG